MERGWSQIIFNLSQRLFFLLLATPPRPRSGLPGPWDQGDLDVDLGMGKKERSVWLPPFLQAGVFPTAPRLPTSQGQTLSTLSLESFARVSLRHTSCISAQTVFAANYVKAFGLQFLVQSMPMFSLGRESVSVDAVKR